MSRKVITLEKLNELVAKIPSNPETDSYKIIEFEPGESKTYGPNDPLPFNPLGPFATMRDEGTVIEVAYTFELRRFHDGKRHYYGWHLCGYDIVHAPGMPKGTMIKSGLEK